MSPSMGPAASNSENMTVENITYIDNIGHGPAPQQPNPKYFPKTTTTVPKWIEISQRVRESREYVRDTWDCSNISNKVVDELQEEGYNALCCCGYYMSATLKEDSLHCWVVIQENGSFIRMDPTQQPNAVISDEFYASNYEMRTCSNTSCAEWLEYKDVWNLKYNWRNNR